MTHLDHGLERRVPIMIRGTQKKEVIVELHEVVRDEELIVPTGSVLHVVLNQPQELLFFHRVVVPRGGIKVVSQVISVAAEVDTVTP